MSDINCGDVDCDGCDCDCSCGDSCSCDCDCDCLDGCCSGESNVILCCCFPFLSSDTNGRRQARHRTDATLSDCSFCCFCCKSPTERSRKSNKNKRKGFCSRLWSCFREESSPPSSSTRDQPEPNHVAPKETQQNRYPVHEDQPQLSPLEYSERRRKPGMWEIEHNIPPRDYKLDGKWSRPFKYGDQYGVGSS